MLQGYGMRIGWVGVMGSYLWSCYTVVPSPFIAWWSLSLLSSPSTFLMGPGLVEVGGVWGEPRAKREHLPQ